MTLRNSKARMWSKVREMSEDAMGLLRHVKTVGPISFKGQAIMPGSIPRHSMKPHLAPKFYTQPVGI